MIVRFQIDYRTQWGQRLYVCGSTPELGNWDTSQALPMNFLPGGRWDFTLELRKFPATGVQYKYFLRDESNGVVQWEKGPNREIYAFSNSYKRLVLNDSWRTTTVEEQALFTSAFTRVLARPGSRPTLKKAAGTSAASGQKTYRFQITAPRVSPNHYLCLVGSDPALGNWDEQKALIMNAAAYPLWQADVALSNPEVLRYKYGIYDAQAKKIIHWETGDDRVLWLEPTTEEPTLRVQTDEGFRTPFGNWRGAGVAIPVFSLRSRQGTGVGEFLDLKLLVDWAVRTGLKLIQILPINDTVATHTWIDSYPYAAISVFALHPIYLNLEAMGTLKNKKDQKYYEQQRELLNQKDFVDYEPVMQVKSRYFKQLYDQNRKEFLADPAFAQFLEKNREWLVPYAVFSRLRDLYGTPDFSQWGEYARVTMEQLEQLASPSHPDYDHVAVHFFIQFHLDKQLSEATQYASRHGIVLKGDIPIGIYRNSVDAWIHPELYHMDSQAGAPPDDFSVSGQNWRFPTYNWEKMSEDDYAWWQARLQKMSAYFDAFRIDHILGFFRIWEIPQEGVDGLLGHFSPALPYHRDELAAWGLWPGPEAFRERYCEPYIRAHMLWDLFGEYRDEVVQKYLIEYQPDHFRLQPAVRTQRQIENLFAKLHSDNPTEQARLERIKAGLFHLTTEVLFLEDAFSNGEAFHPRIAFHNTYSYRELDGWIKERLHALYIDFFYKRHEQFWREKGLIKLPVIKNATNMLVCGEDLGMVPDVVPGVMQELGLLSLFIQRMPKDPRVEFGHPDSAPYLSVVTPSSHDMSTIRGWWEEDRNRTQRFYNQMLGHYGEAPQYCEPWIAKEILLQHLYSPAMWAIFPIQDLLAMDEKLRRPDAREEQINVPANPQHFWKYRLHLSMEDLLQQPNFNEALQEIVSQSGRNTDY